MLKLLVGLLTVFLLQTSAHAADKIRISISNLSGQFMTFPLAHKRGFLKEEGIEAEIIRVTGGASSCGVEQWRSGLRYWHGSRRLDFRITRQGSRLLRAGSSFRTGCAARGQISPGA